MPIEMRVTVGNRTWELAPGEVFTFGRSEGCTCCLDAADRGISRLAGVIVCEQGTWWVVNRSDTRTLHLVDAVGISVPLPVALPGWPPAKRAVDPGGLRVLVSGTVWTHELRCEHDHPEIVTSIDHDDVGETRTLGLRALTPKRKLVLVAMVSGYLRSRPRYDPTPLTYAAIEKLTGVPRSTVHKRIEAVRNQLREFGVRGLDDEDARRGISEWLLAARVIKAGDLAWMENEVAKGKLAGSEGGDE